MFKSWLFSAVFQLSAQVLPKPESVIDGIGERNKVKHVWILLNQNTVSLAVDDDHFKIPTNTIWCRQSKGIETIENVSIID